MKQTICNQVRFEIDEKDLAAPLSGDVLEHLRYCSECQEFQTKETKLRQIVGSLETVNAPADFDFRLRARLANDRSASYRLTSPVRVWRLRSVAVAAMLLIFAGTVFMLRQTDPRQLPNSNADRVTNNESVTPPPKPTDTPSDLAKGDAGSEKVTPAVVEQKNNNAPRRVGPTPSASKRPTVAVDFSSTSAAVIRGEQSSATVATFPLDVSQQSFKVSLDDGRGGSRTISVPAVSFGSRRVLTGGTMSSNQFAPKGDW